MDADQQSMLPAEAGHGRGKGKCGRSWPPGRLPSTLDTPLAFSALGEEGNTSCPQHTDWGSAGATVSSGWSLQFPASEQKSAYLGFFSL